MEGITTLDPATTSADALIQALTAERDQARETAAAVQAMCERAESDLNQARAALTELRSDIGHDVEHLSDRLISEAERRGWCEQYDEIIDDVNGGMRCIVLRSREREYEIDVTITGVATIHKTLTVRAASRQDALDEFQNDPNSYIDLDEELLDGARRNGFVDIEIDQE